MIFPELVDLLELLGLILQLSLNILSVEDVLKVHPLALEGKPLIDSVTNVTEFALPIFDFSTDFCDETRAHHATDRHDIILEVANNVLDFFDDETILGIAVLHDGELTTAPAVNNLVHLAAQVSLTLGHASNFLDVLLLLLGSLFKHTAESQVTSVHTLESRFHLGEDLVPMASFQVLAAKRLNQGAVIDCLLDFLLEGEKDMILLTFLELHLSSQVLLVKELDALHDSDSILVIERFSVPLVVLGVKASTVGPQLVSPLEALLKDVDFWNLHTSADLKNFLVFLILLDFSALLLELFANSSELGEGAGSHDFRLGKHFAIQVIDLCPDFFTLLLNL